ncbi:MAG: RNA-binding protein [Desulfobacterales bacterium S3730MH5]|nr:MAG: RNA-binding protein [Desulfobacterales bacterium S3730MH5]OEU77824.1 MAG: RNA-binding protein [Desulfobacterales bacterium S5133MH4]
MCEANAYVIRNGKEELVMEAVDRIEPENNGLRLVNIFGDQKFIRADIHALHLVDHKVLLKE